MRVPRLRCINGSWFWRPSKSLKARGYKNLPLGKDAVGAIRKAKMLNARIDRELEQAPGPRFLPGSVGDIIRIYTADDRFAKLAASTKRVYRVVLNEIERESGDFMIAEIERPHLREAYRQIKQRGAGIARMHMALWFNLMDLAMDEGLRNNNPAAKMNLAGSEKRTQVWGSANFDRFRAVAAATGRPSVALAVDLAFDLGQRPGDVLALTWKQWSGESFILTQSKTKERLAVPVLSAGLRDHLNSMTRNGVQIVLSEMTGRPYTSRSFNSAFARLRKKAGLPSDLQARDTRRTALTEAGDGGGTDEELRSLSGHRSRKSVEHYVHPSSTMAAGAQAARERARNRSGKIATIKAEK